MKSVAIGVHAVLQIFSYELLAHLAEKGLINLEEELPRYERLDTDSLERDVRAREADWEEIDKLPPKLKAAV